MKTLDQNQEKTEASFLQGKLSKITADEVLDFHLLMTLAPSPDGFIAHYEHDCAVGRASDFIPVRALATINTPPGRKHRPLSLLFHCASCRRDFLDDYIRKAVSAISDYLIRPICPECGSSKFVNEVKEEK